MAWRPNIGHDDNFIIIQADIGLGLTKPLPNI